MQRLVESGKVYENVLDELSKLTGKSEAALREIFKKAGVKAMKFDNAIYKAAGLNPLPLNLSPAMPQVLAAGLRKTQGVIRNLTLTTASSAQNAFIEAADLAYMQVSSGAFDYISAIQAAVRQVAKKGLPVINYASGRQDQLDVAMRRTVLTGVSQTAAQLQITRADEMGQDLVQTSAHIGARNIGEGPANHESWQGKVFSRSGKSKKYPDFISSTGYGTGPGLCGWNCRHSFYPFFEGISENAYGQAELDSYANKTVTYNGKEMNMYDATQYQRGVERKIRHWKRQAGALEAAGLDTEVETGKVRQWQGEMRRFVKETGLIRQSEREKIAPFVPVESVDRDLRLAQQGRLFNLQSKDTETVYSKLIDFRERYGNDLLKANGITFEQEEKGHVWKTHPDDRGWLAANQDLVLKAITDPLYIDALPRKARRSGFNIANIIYIGEQEYPYLNVVINIRNRRAKIWTMFRADKRFIFSVNNQMDHRWIKAK